MTAPHARAIRWRVSSAPSKRDSNALRHAYHGLLTQALCTTDEPFVPVFLVCLPGGFLRSVPWLGQDFFPSTDTGQFILHLRAKTGTRIEETARIATWWRTTIREISRPTRCGTIIDNIGLPYSTINLTHVTTGRHRRCRRRHYGVAQGGSSPDRRLRAAHLRKALPRDFPGVTFYFLPADIVTPDSEFRPAVADRYSDRRPRHRRQSRGRRPASCARSRQVPGIVDARIQQDFDYPNFDVDVDRTKAPQSGFHRDRCREQRAEHL